MLSFDAASIDRLGLLAAPAAAAGELIVLDHHASNTGFGSVSLVDPAAAATAVIAAELIDRLGIAVTRDVALGLYAGLVTDTGSFKYAATTPQVHELAARLLATGIDPGIVARELYDRAPFGYLRLLSAALGRATLEPAAAGGLGLVWTTVTRADRAAAGGLPLDAAFGAMTLGLAVDGQYFTDIAKLRAARGRGSAQGSRRRSVAGLGPVQVRGRRRSGLHRAGRGRSCPCRRVLLRRPRG